MYGRLNIVITNQKKYNAEGVVIVNSLEDAVFVAKSHSYKEVFIIGGGEIFKAALSKAEKIYLTRVHTNIEGEVVFPEINEVKWKKTNSRFYPDDEKHQYSYTFELWERK